MDFTKQFQTGEDYLNHLIEQKWSKGYKCFKGGKDQYGKGRQWFYRRCKMQPKITTSSPAIAKPHISGSFSRLA